jgi:hypothetical protein
MSAFNSTIHDTNVLEENSRIEASIAGKNSFSSEDTE